jgi:hypothetical protein
MPPKVTVEAAVRVDTKVSWERVPGASYRFYARRTDEPSWVSDTDLRSEQGLIINAHGRTISETVPVRGDDWLFGVAACAGEGGQFCSPVSSAVPGGAFEPVGQSEK